ncbi:MAG: hypothetical protein H6621_05515 [Halobacteriovoraceae bacterium]|nr:hypothetical protein [Halobacteriovoraceae bacterium]
MKTRKLAKILLFAFLSTSSVSFAHWFAPENDQKVPVYQKVRKVDGSRTITQKEFDAVIDHAYEILAPVVAERGGKLVIDRRWNDPTVNAYAHREGKEYHVTMFGGLARHKETTPDGFALVVCHEIGHHIGGAPRYDRNTDWASVEGQSDYWATLKCAKRLWENEDNSVVIKDLKKRQRELKSRRRLVYDLVNETVEKSCNEANMDRRTKRVDEDGAALCIRASMGGLSLARLLADLQGVSMPEFETPDTKTVKETYEAHPAAQCRLDTYYQGSLCALPYSDIVDEDNPFQGTCNRIEEDKVGIRPLCWFQPKDYSRRGRIEKRGGSSSRHNHKHGKVY